MIREWLVRKLGGQWIDRGYVVAMGNRLGGHRPERLDPALVEFLQWLGQRLDRHDENFKRQPFATPIRDLVKTERAEARTIHRQLIAIITRHHGRNAAYPPYRTGRPGD